MLAGEATAGEAGDEADEEREEVAAAWYRKVRCTQTK